MVGTGGQARPDEKIMGCGELARAARRRLVWNRGKNSAVITRWVQGNHRPRGSRRMGWRWGREREIRTALASVAIRVQRNESGKDCACVPAQTRAHVSVCLHLQCLSSQGPRAYNPRSVRATCAFARNKYQ